MKVTTFNERNVNHVFPIAVEMFRKPWPYIERVRGRAGKETLEHQGVVTSTYQHATERVLFCPVRDANPFFHFFEALWIVAGRNDVKWISYFLQGITRYSDDGKIFHGAYGKRLDTGGVALHDQLHWVIQHLYRDSNSRRAVIHMFDARQDHVDNSSDIPCNLALNFLMRNGRLHLTVYCRSNDMVWGAYGANVVQFSTILELVARCLGIPVGTYTQVSNSFHVYPDEPSWQRVCNKVDLMVVDPYGSSPHWKSVEPHPLIPLLNVNRTPLQQYNQFKASLAMFMEETTYAITRVFVPPIINEDYGSKYFNNVAVPLFYAFSDYRQGKFDTALEWVKLCHATDWKLACEQWLLRRKAK